MSDPVARELQRSVRAVLARLDLKRSTDGDGVRTAEREERPDQPIVAGSDSGKPAKTCSSSSVEQHRLGLIILGMACGDRLGTDLRRGAPKELIPSLSRTILAPRSLGGLAQVNLRLESLCQSGYEFRVCGGLGWPKKMIEMGYVEAQCLAPRHRSKQKKQCR